MRPQTLLPWLLGAAIGTAGWAMTDKVAEPAKFMLHNPQVFKAIETHDVAGADGKSGIGNFQAAARGEVRGVKGAEADEAKNDVADLLREMLQAITMQQLLQALQPSAPRSRQSH